MTENSKTITFVAIGLVAVALALLTRPSPAVVDQKSLVGNVLTAKFDDPDDAKRLKITRFDEDTATLREFEVAEQDGLWTIPSKDGYPADAARQMAEATLSLKDRKILATPSFSPNEHAEYGVIDPLSPKLEAGQKGVGTHVTLSDSHGDALVDLIIGKEVKDAKDQRYVREASRDIVYVIDIDPAKLSTSFADWIEKDLLKLDALDLEKVKINDYSAELVASQGGVGIDRDARAEMTLAVDPKGDNWSVEKIRKFDRAAGDYADYALTADEELNQEALNGLKTALDDLKIVDVVRKPTGLSEDLKAGQDFLNNREAILDLVTKGFTPAAAQGGPQEILASDGEVIATMKDGAEYVLRFGNLTNVAGPQKDQKADAAQAANKGPEKSDVHRYLFAMARFNEDAVKKPELAELPKLPEGATEKNEGDAAAAPADDKAKTDAEKTDSDKEKDKDKAGAEKSDSDKSKSEVADKKDEAAKPDDDATKPDAKQAEIDNIIAERKRIEAENQRKLDAYQAQLKRGREQVKDLNLRFGDWYFVVDNSVFNKVRLGADTVIKKKGTAPTNGGEKPGAMTPAGLPGGALPGVPTFPGAGG